MKAFTNSDGDNIKLAIAAILFTALALSFGDALIKHISADFPLWQIFVVRSAIAAPVLIAFIKARRQTVSLLPKDVRWTALRSLLLTFMWVAYYAALPNLALSIAAAAYYTTPLFIVMFAALFLGDKIGRAGWSAVSIGFLGVVLILRPQANDFNVYALLPLIAAILYALAMIITRTKCRTENPLVLSLGLNLSFIAVGSFAAGLIELWGPPSDQAENQRVYCHRWYRRDHETHLGLPQSGGAQVHPETNRVGHHGHDGAD